MQNQINWKERHEYLKREVFFKPGKLQLSALTLEQRCAVIDYLLYLIYSNENFEIELQDNNLKVIAEIPVSEVAVK